MMRRTGMWLIVAVLPTVALAQYTPTGVSGSLDVAFQSQFIWRGFNFFGENSAMQYTADVALEGTGFGASAQAHIANGGGHVINQRWDYNIFWQNTVWEDQYHTVDYRAGFVWYNEPRRSSSQADIHELYGMFAFPNVTGVPGLVPAYTIIKAWQAEGGPQSLVSNANGWAHVFSIDYNFDAAGLTPESPKQPVGLFGEITYNGGINPLAGGGVVDHDWSHAVIGAETEFDMGNNIIVTPAVFYQVTMDASVNPNNDELWVTIGGQFTF